MAVWFQSARLLICVNIIIKLLSCSCIGGKQSWVTSFAIKGIDWHLWSFVAFHVCCCCISCVLLLHFMGAIVAFLVCSCCISCVLLLHFMCALVAFHMSPFFVLFMCMLLLHFLRAQVGKPQRPYGHFDDMYHAFICHTSHMRSGWQATAALRSFR